MLKIRLTRMGKKHQPSYRIVVTPKENPVMGQYLELVGTYNPLKQEVAIDNAKAMEWLNKGAQPSERVARLLDKAGLKHKSIVVKYYTPKPKEEVAKPEKAAAAEPEETVGEETQVDAPEEQPAPEPTKAAE